VHEHLLVGYPWLGSMSLLAPPFKTQREPE